MMGNLRIESLAAQVDVLEPVVEAAVAFVKESSRWVNFQEVGGATGTALLKAVREYEEALKEEG